jgi:hypothetical protein
VPVKLIDNKEVFLYACALRQPPRAVRKPLWRTRTKKLPYYRVHSVGKEEDCALGRKRTGDTAREVYDDYSLVSVYFSTEPRR